jgi:hypothetical protein
MIFKAYFKLDIFGSYVVLDRSVVAPNSHVAARSALEIAADMCASGGCDRITVSSVRSPDNSRVPVNVSFSILEEPKSRPQPRYFII